MSGIQIVPAELTGFILETWVFGMYAVVYGICIYVLVASPSRRVAREQINTKLIAMSSLLLLATTIHWVLDIVRAFHAFVVHGGTPEGPTLSYGNIADPFNVARTGVFVMEIVTADAIFIYRLWAVWHYNKLVVSVPIVFILAAITSGTGAVYQFSQVTLGEDVFNSECGKWITSAFTLTLCTNLYCSGMITYKIWMTERAVQHLRNSKLMYVLVVIVESTAIYTICTLCILVLYLAKSNAQFIFVSLTSPVVGLAFTLITVRIGLGIGRRHIESTVLPTVGVSEIRFHQPQRHPTDTADISVNVTHHIESGGVNDSSLTIEQNDDRSVKKGDELC